jgi:hypothetical protein
VFVAEHTPEGAAAAAPLSLGRAIRPALRVLSGPDAADAGPAGARFRCALRLAPPPRADMGAAGTEEVEARLALRTQEDLDALARLVGRCPPAPGRVKPEQAGDARARTSPGRVVPDQGLAEPWEGGDKGGPAAGATEAGATEAGAAEAGAAEAGAADSAEAGEAESGGDDSEDAAWTAAVARAMGVLRRCGPAPPPADPGLVAAVRALARCAGSGASLCPAPGATAGDCAG